MANITEQQAIAERAKYVNAFNATMIKIWQEQITLLDVIDTGQLLHSPISLPIRADGRFFNIALTQTFIKYGLFQEYGTGKEVFKGNGGDIGKTKVREKKPWFSKKYYSSFLNIRDFMADNLGKEFCGIISDRLSQL